jgi:hypothetical protein
MIQPNSRSGGEKAMTDETNREQEVEESAEQNEGQEIPGDKGDQESDQDDSETTPPSEE